MPLYIRFIGYHKNQIYKKSLILQIFYIFTLGIFFIHIIRIHVEKTYLYIKKSLTKRHINMFLGIEICILCFLEI